MPPSLNLSVCKFGAMPVGSPLPWGRGLVPIHGVSWCSRNGLRGCGTAWPLVPPYCLLPCCHAVAMVGNT